MRVTRLRRTRLFIGEALAFRALDGAVSALCVVNAQLHTVRVPEVKLVQIRLQMMFGAMMIGAGHPAFEDTEKALDGVCRSFRAVLFGAGVFLVTVIDGFVVGKVLAILHLTYPVARDSV